MTGSNTAFAGGGGGSTYAPFGGTAGTGGIGGGAPGIVSQSINGNCGNVNTGGGGGGIDTNGTNCSGGGGSGIVVISYSGPQRALGGSNVYSCLGNTIHIFCASGSLNFS
jgi:hypothetical protein